jgi:hypothetical protein
MAKKIATKEPNEQKKPASAESLLALADLLRKYGGAFEQVAKELKNSGKSEVLVRGRDGVDMFIKRLDGYLRNSNEAAGHLFVGEPKNSYHIQPSEKQQQ